MTYTRYLYVAFYTPGMDKTRQDKNFIYTWHTEKKTLTDYLGKVQASYS